MGALGLVPGEGYSRNASFNTKVYLFVFCVSCSTQTNRIGDSDFNSAWTKEHVILLGKQLHRLTYELQVLCYNEQTGNSISEKVRVHTKINQISFDQINHVQWTPTLSFWSTYCFPV